jgi:hypothetical protein
MALNNIFSRVLASLKAKRILWFALVVGIALRLFGITWGLPVGLHPDEYVIVQGALDMIRNNTLEPAYFYRPDHVEIQISYWVYQIFSNVFLGKSPTYAYLDYPGLFLGLSRLVTVVFGVAMIPLAYAIGKRFNLLVANSFAAVIAIFLPLVQHSHFATPDVPQATMFMVLTLALMKYIESPKWGYLLLASWATAVATAAKYPGLLATLAIAAVIIYVARKSGKVLQILSRGFTAVVFFLIALLITAPALFTHFDEVQYQIILQSSSSNDVGSGLGFFDTLIFYLNQFAIGGGLVLTFFTLAGFLSAIRMRSPITIPIFLGPVYLIIISFIPLHWPRWAVPVWPALLLFAAIGLSQVLKGFERNGMTARARKIFFSIVASFVLINSTVASVSEDIRFNSPDTRVTARQDLKQLGADKSNTIFEGYTPLNPTYPGTIFESFNDPYIDPTPIDSAKKYILISGCVAGTYQDSSKFPQQKNFYILLEKNYKEVWRLNKDVGQLSQVPFEPANIVARSISAAKLLSGGETGCDLVLYSTKH